MSEETLLRQDAGGELPFQVWSEDDMRYLNVCPKHVDTPAVDCIECEPVDVAPVQVRDVRLVADGEAVKAVIRAHVFANFGTFSGVVNACTDAVMALARPMPTQEQIAEALKSCGAQQQIDEWPAEYRRRQAAAVLALINGTSE